MWYPILSRSNFFIYLPFFGHATSTRGVCPNSDTCRVGRNTRERPEWNKSASRIEIVSAAVGDFSGKCIMMKKNMWFFFSSLQNFSSERWIFCYSSLKRKVFSVFFFFFFFFISEEKNSPCFQSRDFTRREMFAFVNTYFSLIMHKKNPRYLRLTRVKFWNFPRDFIQPNCPPEAEF